MVTFPRNFGSENNVSANQGEMSFREKAAKATVSKKITRRKWSKQDFKLVAEAVSACQIQRSSILAISTYAGI